MKVLFVCTGNICRSPMAEGVFEQKARAAGLHAVSDSAGTDGYHIGDPPDPRAQDVAGAAGYDISRQQARRVQARDFDTFDLMVGLDSGHVRRLSARAPAGARARIVRLLDYVPDVSTVDVPDPYYGRHADFEIALDLIERGIDGLIHDLIAGVRP